MAPDLTQIASPNAIGLLPVPSGPLRVSESPGGKCSVALSLVLPTLNEAENIEAMVLRLNAVLKHMGNSYEIIIVDDNSADRTWERGLRLAQAVPELRVLRRTDQRGLATAVVRGWQIARGEVLGVIDADLQHPPEVVPKLWKAIQSGADVAVASRWAPGGGVGQWSSRRRLISRTAQTIGEIILPEVFGRLTDPLSGLFLLRRETLMGVKMNPRGYKILIEVLARASSPRVTEVGYIFQERLDAKSKVTWRVYRDYLLHLAILRFRRATGEKSHA